MYILLATQMELIRCNLITIAFLTTLWIWDCEAQSSRDSTNLARKLDSFLQEYAYRSFIRPRTGISYDGFLPSNFTGVKIDVIRLRTGSLRTRGVHNYREFDIPSGVIVQPYVKRLAIVYQNLGNLSSFYYPLPGYTYIAPVLGLLAYSAANLSATNLQELDIMASSSPISIKFTNLRYVPIGLTAKCVWFTLNGSVEFKDLVANEFCTAFHQGHFSIVVNSTMVSPAPALSPFAAQSFGPSRSNIPGKGHKSNMWKIVVFIVCGFFGLILMSLFVAWVISYRKKKELMERQKREDTGEFLLMRQVGNTQLPVALITRTQPVIESEYAI